MMDDGWMPDAGCQMPDAETAARDRVSRAAVITSVAEETNPAASSYPSSSIQHPASRSKPARRHADLLQLLVRASEQPFRIAAILHHLAVDPRLVVEVQ